MSRLDAERLALRMGREDTRNIYVARPKPQGGWCIAYHPRNISVHKGRD